MDTEWYLSVVQYSSTIVNDHSFGNCWPSWSRHYCIDMGFVIYFAEMCAATLYYCFVECLVPVFFSLLFSDDECTLRSYLCSYLTVSVKKILHKATVRLCQH